MATDPPRNFGATVSESNQEPLPTQIEIQTGEGAPEEGKSPYKNLWVPLLVVPALIAMVLVLVASFFQLLSTEEKTPEENLALLLNGGINERQQASFELVRQILEFETASHAGREAEWGIDASFLDTLRRERERIPEPQVSKDVWVPFVLSSLLAQLGDADGVEQLVEVTRLGEAFDENATFRTNAIFVLGSIGLEMGEPERLHAAERMIEIVAGEDDGLALLAAGALQNLASPGTVEALRGLLGHRRADLRLQAALSLVELGDSSGADVLLGLVGREAYEQERAQFPKRWPPQVVSPTRLKVLDALAKLDRLPDAAELRAAAEEDADPNFKSKVLELLGEGQTPSAE